MKTSVKVPPHLVIKSSKEVIFYIPKKSDTPQEISVWLKELNLPDYIGMVMNSKCIFNRLKNKQCE